jgi:hypothetical protein
VGQDEAWMRGEEEDEARQGSNKSLTAILYQELKKTFSKN